MWNQNKDKGNAACSLWCIIFCGVILCGCTKKSVPVSVNTKNAADAIISFSMPFGQTDSATISSDSSTVTVYVLDTTSLSSVSPSIQVSPKASISPALGTKVNFAANGDSIIYTVTSQSGVARKWHVKINFIYNTFIPDNTTPTQTITWSTSAVKISHNVNNAEYGRVHRIDANTLLLTYQFGQSSQLFADSIAVRRSTDNGVTWSNPQIFVPPAGYVNLSGAETYVLHNGWVMMAYAALGTPGANDNNTIDDVRVTISKDGGQTWGPSQIIAQGRSWEPDIVQLPDGDIEVFYSSEAAWWPY
jgi:hypothetical protein